MKINEIIVESQIDEYNIKDLKRHGKKAATALALAGAVASSPHATSFASMPVGTKLAYAASEMDSDRRRIKDISRGKIRVKDTQGDIDEDEDNKSN